MARTKTGTPPSYRLHKPTGRAVVTIGDRDIYIGEYGTEDSRRQYGLLLAGETAPKAKRDPEPSEQAITVVEVLAAFWNHAQSYYVKNGEPTNELDALRLVIRDARTLYGREPAESFGPKKLKAVRQLWIDRGQARPTVNKNQRRLTRIFRWAVAEELIPGAVLHSLTAVPGLKKGRCDLPEPPPIQPVPLEVVERTIPHLPPVIQDMIRFQLLTGARPGEVCTLRPGDVDRSTDVWEYRVEGHKTEHHGRQRIVYIGPEAQALLRPYLLRAPDQVCFSMAEAVEQRRQAASEARKTPPSCGNRRGKRSNADRKSTERQRTPQVCFDPSSYRHAIHHACDAAFQAPEPLGQREGESRAARGRRLPEAEREQLDEWQKQHRWHPNQLRHTRGTEVRKQFGLEAAQVILGHAAADVTQIYAERDAEKAREVARRIG
ncbi:tyrosine-type recombinase/integrase [Candidatus Laterigemmans baculatus]|uniref:tyrosine-type recombinase/integrase n=1 Tax=Candidatus Laterigemmans baculatus TaxID=2770505 RepID=UPI0013D9F8A8|nr:site-specific integrase [Candidatus Laterigemmans baculatus]